MRPSFYCKVLWSAMFATHLFRQRYSLDYSKLLFKVFLHSKPLLSYYFFANLALSFSDFERQRLSLHFSLSIMTSLSFINFIKAVYVVIRYVINYGHLTRSALCYSCLSLLSLQMRVAHSVFTVTIFCAIVGSGPSSHSYFVYHELA